MSSQTHHPPHLLPALSGQATYKAPRTPQLTTHSRTHTHKATRAQPTPHAHTHNQPALGPPGRAPTPTPTTPLLAGAEKHSKPPWCSAPGNAAFRSSRRWACPPGTASGSVSGVAGAWAGGARAGCGSRAFSPAPPPSLPPLPRDSASAANPPLWPLAACAPPLPSAPTSGRRLLDEM